MTTVLCIFGACDGSRALGAEPEGLMRKSRVRRGFVWLQPVRACLPPWTCDVLTVYEALVWGQWEGTDADGGFTQSELMTDRPPPRPRPRHRTPTTQEPLRWWLVCLLQLRQTIHSWRMDDQGGKGGMEERKPPPMETVLSFTKTKVNVTQLSVFDTVESSAYFRHGVLNIWRYNRTNNNRKKPQLKDLTWSDCWTWGGVATKYQDIYIFICIDRFFSTFYLKFLKPFYSNNKNRTTL